MAYESKKISNFFHERPTLINVCFEFHWMFEFLFNSKMSSFHFQTNVTSNLIFNWMFKSWKFPILLVIFAHLCFWLLIFWNSTHNFIAMRVQRYKINWTFKQQQHQVVSKVIVAKKVECYTFIHISSFGIVQCLITKFHV